ncbi:hypothetical protein BDN70DRAFT_976142 [Pholiota conissans]|uniref:Uncharacterized protein n=1 Tax=Pholiota conissans TaxID=109636 RepID=A0A9P6CRV6_9AGAR|nr:hypothetical protein BDN70DRAFT_976142 [Pholiota conissans]
MSSWSTSSSSPPAIELRKETLSTIKKPSVWSIDEETRNVQPVPTTAQPSLIDGKCDRNTTEDGVCCKDFKKVDRTLINPDIIRDVIIGLSDGLTVPFALTAGLSSLGESKLVVLGGVAELIAGALSMGIGGFLASQAERDHYRYLRQHTLQRVHRSCAGEIEREVLGVLGPVGVDEPTCRAVARSLHDVEDHTPEGGYHNVNGHPVDDREALGIRMSKDAGLTAFFVKFGQGLGIHSSLV